MGVKNVIPKTTGTAGQDDYEWISRQNSNASLSKEMTGSTGGTGGANTSSGSIGVNADHSPSVVNTPKIDTRGPGYNSGAGASVAPVSAAPSTSGGGYSSIFDKNSELMDYIDMLNEQNNSWAEKYYNLSNQQSANAAEYAKALESIYKQGQDDAYTKAEEERKRALQAGVEQATNTITGQKEKVSSSYDDALRQLYINNMLSKKNIGQQMAAMGATGGLAESTLLGLDTSYADALRKSESEKILALNDLDRQLTDAKLAATIEEANGAADSAIGRASSYSQVLQSLLNREDSNKASQLAVLANLMSEEDSRRGQNMALAQYMNDNNRADTAEDRQYAYNLATSMISSGIMPSAEMLTAAGISQSDAQAIVTQYQAQKAAKGTGTAKVQKPSQAMYDVALAAYQAGDRSQQVIDTITAYNDGLAISSIEKAYGIGTPAAVTNQIPADTGNMGVNYSDIAANVDAIYNSQGKNAALDYVKKAYIGIPENHYIQQISFEGFNALNDYINRK